VPEGLLLRVPLDPKQPTVAEYSEHAHEISRALGEAASKRACFVEPGDPEKGQDPDRWYVDPSPLDVAGLKVEESFDTRASALEHEHKVLEDYFYRRGQCILGESIT
jgi:hypothetical protein